MLGDWDLATAAAAVHGRVAGANQPFSRIVSDSRADCSNSLFVALKGEHFNGHDYLAAAAGQGAVGVVVSENAPTRLPRIRVVNTTRALGLLGAHNRTRSRAKVIGITGSSGKTTVTNMLASVLRQAVGAPKVHATTANHNNEIGVAQTLLGIDAAHDYALVEMGARHPGDIALLAGVSAPTTSLVNNIGHSHLALLPNLEAVAKEKAAIFGEHQGRAPDYALAPHQAASAYDLFQRAGVHTNTLTFGLLEEGADASLSSISLAANQTEACLALPSIAERKSEQIHIALQVGGMHQLHNAAAAALAAWVNGISAGAIERGLSAFRAPPGRQHTRQFGQLTIIDDCYNANPDSTRAALEHLALHQDIERTAVLGDMLELGEASESLHRQIGEVAADLGIERLLTYGAMAGLAGESYSHGQGQWRHFVDSKTLTLYLLALLKETDKTALLIKGSRGMRMEGIVDAVAKRFSQPVSL